MMLATFCRKGLLMVRDLPKPLQRAVWCQVLGILLLCWSLFVGRALPFILTLGGGCFFLALALVFFLIYYFSAVKTDPVGESTSKSSAEGA